MYPFSFKISLSMLVIIIFVSSFVMAYEEDSSSLEDATVTVILDQKGIKLTLEFIKDAYEQGNLTSDECHFLLHRLGEISSGKFGIKKSMHEASEVIELCRTGFIHGLFLGADFEDINVSDLCIQSLKSSALRLQCFHGLGHGLEVFFNYNLNEALSVCKLENNVAYRSACLSGVFMEEFSPRMHLSRNSTNETFSICEENEFMRECFWYVGIRVTEQNVSLSEGLKKCNTLDVKYKLDCEKGFGVLAARRSNYKLSEILFVCNDSKACLLGAASEFGLSKEIPRGLSLCTRVSWNSTLGCFSELISGYSKHF